MSRPSRSLIWLLKMLTAMPAVNPVMTGCGMYLTRVPRRSSPARTSIAPAIRVATIMPSYPWFAMTLNTTGMKAAVGPPICTREPPSSEIRKPAMIAVCRPTAGDAPDAIASAIDSGSATIATVSPASRSRRKSPGP